MRTQTAIAIIGLVALAGPVRGSEKEAKEILNRAIKAHGGAAALTRAAQLKRTDVGNQVVLARAVPFTSQVVRSLPDKVRLTVEAAGTKTVLVLNGEKAWQSDGGPAAELLPARASEVRDEAYVDYVATLVPLTKAGYTLSSLPKAKVGGEAVAGIKAVHKGRPDVRLYFSEKTGLLAKIEREARVAGLKVDQEYLYGAYKDFDGVKLPTKQTVMINGKKFTEFTSGDVTFPVKLDEKTFAKP
jgi:hypothetical protein